MSVDMKTLTIDSQTFEIVDAEARQKVNELQAAVGSPLVASTASAMTDHNKVYVYTGSETGYTSGNWYYWNGSEWESGGVYQSQGINTDKTLTVPDAAADAEKTGDEIIALKTSIPVEAELDDEGIATFYNEGGTSVFTLDLSELGGGGASYSNVNVSTNSIDMTEGETTTFTVVLADAPTGNQPVYVAVSDSSKLSVSPSSVWFTTSDWNQTKTVTVTSLQDSDQTSETVTITVSSRRVSSKQITVSITDDDYSIVETGLEAYWNYRDGTLTDSVKNITTTNGGTYQDHGLYTNDGSAKIQFIYPVQTANIPNGFTLEVAMVGFTSPVAAGTGSGSGYAYQSNDYNGYCWGGFFMYCDGAIRKLNNTQTQIKYDETGLIPDLVDTSGEHIYAYVYHADGSADMYVDGTHFGARLASANSDFERYNVSGNMTFKFPYFSDLTGSINLKEIRIYERDLSSTEIVQNYRATQSHQNEINFS